jgi:DNA polymerase III psi subunit
MDKEDSVVASTVDDALSWMDHVIEQDMATSPSVQSENEDVSPLDQAGATWTLVVDLPTLPQPSCDQVLTTDAILPLLADFEHVKHQMDTIIKLFRDGVLDSCGIQLQQQGQQLVLSCDKWTGAEGRLLLRRWLSKLGIDVTTVRIVPLLEKVPETREESVLARWRLGTESYLAHEHQSESMAFLAQLDALARPAFARKPPH